MQKKTISIIITAATLACLLFLPLYGGGVIDASLWDVITKVGVSVFFEDLLGISYLATLILAVVALVFAITDDVVKTVNSSLLGVGVVILGFIVTFIMGAETGLFQYGGSFGDILKVYFSPAILLCTAGFVTNAIYTNKI